MNIDDLSFLLGKSKQEVEEMLKSEDVICLNLNERSQKTVKEEGKIEVLN